MTRGNHMHMKKSEVLVIVHDDGYEFAWRDPGSDQTHIERIIGSGTEFACLAPSAAHAVRNTGKSILRLLSVSNASNDPGNPDTVRVELI